MAIAKRPQRNPAEIADGTVDRKAEAFIAGAGKQASEESSPHKKPILVRVDPGLLVRIDRAAKRLGLSRAAFMVSSSVKELERMEE
jgi:hypothetical protein